MMDEQREDLGAAPGAYTLPAEQIGEQPLMMPFDRTVRGAMSRPKSQGRSVDLESGWGWEIKARAAE
jgi:hypothetical protein